MKLCIDCNHYDDSGSNAIKCSEGYWMVRDKSKSKIFNPMMYECIKYEGIIQGDNFDDDHLFDLFVDMMR